MATWDRLYYHEQFVLLFSHKLQWWRYLLCNVIISVYNSAVVGRLGSDWILLGPGFARMQYLDLLIVVLSLFSRVIWSYLFRDPNRLFRFRRPSKGYRWAVYALSFFSVVPGLLLYIPLFVLSSRMKGRFALGASIAQIVCYAVPVGVSVWMANRFLLGEDDAHYEPTIASTGALPNNDSSPAALPAYSDDPPNSHPLSSSPLLLSQTQLTLVDYLDAAYSEQPALGTPTPERMKDRRASSLSASETRHDVETYSVVDASNKNTSTSSVVDASNMSSSTSSDGDSLQCRTLARFDYMPQGRIGPHSWFTWPLVPLVLASMNTIYFILVWALNHENKNAKIPSSKARWSLLAPLGVYLLCGFACKYHVRQSLFSRSVMALPSPWIPKTFWITKPLFVHDEHGTSTRVDPRRRAFPVDETTAQRALRSAQYLKAYNSNPSTCEGYWGHRGRNWSTVFRSKPTLLMLSFFGSAFTLYAIGLFSVFQYPLHVKELLRLPNMTIPDWMRFFRLGRLKMALMISSYPLFVLVILFLANSVLSILTLWCYAVLENVADGRQQYQEAVRQAQPQAELGPRRAQEHSRRLEAQNELNRQEHQGPLRQPTVSAY